MSAPAINIALPATTSNGSGAAGSANPAGSSAAAGFEAVLGALFGDQDGLAAQLFAGAKPGAKAATDALSGGADATADDANADPNAALQALAGAFLALPPTAPPPTTTALSADATGAPASASAPVTPAVPGAQANAPVLAEAAKAAGPPTTPAAAATPDAAAKPETPALQAQAASASAIENAPSPPQPPAAKADLAAASIQAASAEAPSATAQAATTPPPRNPSANAEKASRPADASGIEGAATVSARTPAVPPIAQASTGDGTNFAKDGKGAAPEAAILEHKPDGDEHRAQPTPLAPLPAAVATPLTHAATPLRAATETVAHMAAQIAKQVGDGSTRFDFELMPAGLGRVDVRVEISAHGQITAAMSFDNPNAAAEMRSRSHELTRALEQAGFDLSGGLSFDVAGDRGQAGQGMPQQRDDSGEAWRGRAFQAALDVAGETDAASASALFNPQRRSLTGVDIRI